MKKVYKKLLLLLVLATVSVSLTARTNCISQESEIEPSMRVVEKNGTEHFYLLKHRPSLTLDQDSITILADDFVTHEIASLSHISFATQISPYTNTDTGVSQIAIDSNTEITVNGEDIIIYHQGQSDECCVCGLDGQIWINTPIYADTYNRISLSKLPSGWHIIKSGQKSIKYHKP